MGETSEVIMKKILIVILCLCLSLILVGCETSKVSTPKPPAIETCNLTAYKKYAQPLMQEFSNILDQTDIRDASSRKITKSSLESLLTRINQVKCKSDFPLKQETLVYSVKHMLDAINYMDKGAYEEATLSINKSLVNVENFQDWTVDVE